MLEKNKDYVELTLQRTVVERSRDRNYREVCFNGYSDSDFPGVPMDVVCKEFDHKVVMISKRDFERLQSDDQHYREMAKQWEENYNLLLKKTGFDTVEELVNYLDSEAQCDTLCDAWKAVNRELKQYEKDYISERDKAEALQTENEELKKKLHEFDHIRDYKELLEKLYSKEDVEKLEWTLNHVCGGQDSVNGWMVSSKLWRQNYETISKLVGFSSVEEIQDYLTNEAECDTLQEAVSKLKDQVKYTCEEWYSANSSNNSWKAAAECNSPKELIEKRETLEKEIDVYSRALKEWKEGTGCPSPSAVKSLLEHCLDENKKLQKKIDELRDDISGRSTVIESDKREIERLRGVLRRSNSVMLKTLYQEIDTWQKATGCNTPEEAEKKIKLLVDDINVLMRVTED